MNHGLRTTSQGEINTEDLDQSVDGQAWDQGGSDSHDCLAMGKHTAGKKGKIALSPVESFLLLIGQCQFAFLKEADRCPWRLRQ